MTVDEWTYFQSLTILKINNFLGYQLCNNKNTEQAQPKQTRREPEQTAEEKANVNAQRRQRYAERKGKVNQRKVKAMEVVLLLKDWELSVLDYLV